MELGPTPLIGATDILLPVVDGSCTFADFDSDLNCSAEMFGVVGLAYCGLLILFESVIAIPEGDILYPIYAHVELYPIQT